MERWLGVALALGVLGVTVAQAVPVSITGDPPVQIGQTAVFRAAMDFPEAGTIQGVVIRDLNRRGGSSGVFSGFDVDFLLFDRDGDLATTHDQILPLRSHVTYIDPGSVREDAKGGPSRYQPTDLHPGPLFGLLDGNMINHQTATLTMLDAKFQPGVGVDGLSVDTSDGWLSLGDGGELTVGFPVTSVGGGQSLYLFIGDVGEADEVSSASFEVVVFDPNVGSPNGKPRLGPGEFLNLDYAQLGAGQQNPSWRWEMNADDRYDDGDGPRLTITYEYLTETLGLPKVGLANVVVKATFEGGAEERSMEIELVPEPTTILLLGVALPLVLRRRFAARARSHHG